MPTKLITQQHLGKSLEDYEMDVRREREALARAQAEVAAGQVVEDHEIDAWLDRWAIGSDPMPIPSGQKAARDAG